MGTSIKEFAFILKRYLPNKHKFSILTSTRGKVEIVPSPIVSGEKLWPGMLISYFYEESYSKICFVNSVEILLSPDAQLSWIHTLLELTYYFAPSHSPAPDVFKVIYRADSFAHFDDFFGDKYLLFQKMFIITLMKCFGFFPDNAFLDFVLEFEKVVLGSVDFPNMRSIKSLQSMINKISDEENYLIDKWIKKCIMRHPNAHSFNSMSFLKQEVI